MICYRDALMNEFQERIGVGTTNYGLARTGPTRKRTVPYQEGPKAGQVEVIYTDHSSGRVDATVLGETVKRTISQKVD
jgi:hypothetical protein